MKKKKGQAIAVNDTEVKELLSQIDTVRNIVAKDATDEELRYFAQFCVVAGLNPVVNQIHFVKRGNKPTFQTGIDGFRVIAERSGKYTGQSSVKFGAMVDRKMAYRKRDRTRVDITKKVPESATIQIYRKDFDKPLEVTVYWDEFCPSFPNQTMWIKMPRNQLEKVAEAKGLRKAFPNDLGNVYTNEEMAQADGSVVSTDDGGEQVVAINEKVKAPKEKREDVENEVFETYKSQMDDARTVYSIEALLKRATKALDVNLMSDDNYRELAKTGKEKLAKLKVEK